MATGGNFETDTATILDVEKYGKGSVSTSNQPPIYNPSAPPPEPGDLPPPYSETPIPPYTQQTPTPNVTLVKCQVCQHSINIAGKTGRVAQCQQCNEVTAIKPPLSGRKYYRCPCNCLLTCNVSSTKVSCPRDNCRRVLLVGNPQTTVDIPPVSVARTASSMPVTRYRCVHCNSIFTFGDADSRLAICPHCKNSSSAGPQAARRRGVIFLCIGLLFAAAAIGTTIGTVLAESPGGFYVFWIGAYVLALLNISRSIYFFNMKVSYPTGD